MTRQDHLMAQAMEECAELAQRVSKAMRFGMEESQPGQSFTNRERIIAEYNDLVAVMDMAGFPLQVINGNTLDAKQEKVEKYLAYASVCGTVEKGE